MLKTSSQKFDEFVRKEKIPEKYWACFMHFTDEDSKGYGNMTESYVLAGHARHATNKYRARDLFKKPLMRTLLYLWKEKQVEKRELKKETAFERVQRRNQDLYDQAALKDPPDLALMKQCNEFDAKLNGLLVDRHQVLNPESANDVNEGMQQAALEVANNALLPERVDDDTPLDENNTIDAEFEIEQTEAAAPDDSSAADGLPDGWLDD